MLIHLSIPVKWFTWTAALLVAFLVLACSAPAVSIPAAARNILPSPTPQPATTPSPAPTQTISPTASQPAPPVLPPIFTSSSLRQGDTPHTYLQDTCQYLKARWQPGNSPAGTVVMPIMFHSITNGRVHYNDQMTVEAFDDLMHALIDAGFQAIHMKQLVAFLEENASIPARSVLLIVDDRKGEEYYFHHFKPYYEHYGWPVVNAWISATDTSDDLWAEHEHLEEYGWVDHQAHGVVHNITATGKVDDKFLRAEMYGSIEAIQEHFGKSPLAYIWPGGNFTPRAIEIARQAGYKVGFTVNPRGPLMFNWVPLADDYNPKRPTYLAEGAMHDPLMVLPRYWSTDAILHIPRVLQIAEEAAAAAAQNRSREFEYYDIVCSDVTGPLFKKYP